jgi:hypothetical protein
MARKDNYEIVKIEPHPVKGFVINWVNKFEQQNNRHYGVSKTHIPIDDLDEVMKEFEEVVAQLVPEAMELPKARTDKITELETKLKAKGIQFKK